ncbi:MAG: D-aminoacylase [Candidatus Bathyarchaeia archaeon]
MGIEYDVLIVNGRIFDGTGNPWFYGDIGIIGDRIAAIGRRLRGDAKILIDASRLAVSPGFIDMHGHSDLELLVDGRALSKTMQGVTLEVIGNCGGSAAPLNDFLKAHMEKFVLPNFEGAIRLEWNTMGEYFKRLEESGISLNVASYVGHSNVRACVIGFERREPKPKELEEMKRLVENAMLDGAIGMSTGLIYPPSSYAKTEEIVELAKVVAKHGGIYASHIRGEGETLLEAVREAIRIGEEANLPVEISHFKSSGKRNWGKIKEAAELIEEARARGVDVTADQYPYTASSTNLSALLPDWAHEGGSEKLLERLKNLDTRAAILKHLKRYSELEPDYWDRIIIAQLNKNLSFLGKSIKEISNLLGLSPEETVIKLLIDEEARISHISFNMCDEDVEFAMQKHWVMVGSDGSAVSPEGVLSKGKPHPRYYGTFPRLLGVYVREKRTLSLEQAIRKMCYLPAWRLGFRERGIIREGAYADITIFNPDTIRDNATFTDPHRFPTGILHVLVNGVPVVLNGKHTGEKPGRVLRRKMGEFIY